MNDTLATIQPRPRKTVFDQYVARFRFECERNPYWYSPDKWYRWLARIDCGCVTEVLTRENLTPPTEHTAEQFLGDADVPAYKRTWILDPPTITMLDGTVRPNGSMRYFDRGCQKPYPCGYPKGYLWCGRHGEKHPWREITEFLDRRELISKEGKPFAAWTTMLSCGHCYGHTNADTEWSPGMPHHVEHEWIKTLQEKRIPQWKKDGKYPDTVQNFEENIEHNGFLVCRPAMAEECAACVCLRRITDYRLIGKLADHPLPKPAEKAQPTPEEIRERKARRLKRVESELARLQKEAKELRGDTS